MPKILYNANLITPQELNAHKELINTLLSGELKYPQAKKLTGMNYLNLPVYRAKIDKKNRLIYTYQLIEGEKTLCILAVNNHNYGKLKRQLAGASKHLSEANVSNENPKDNPAATDEPSSLIMSHTDTKIEYLPAIPHNKNLLIWDAEQHEAHQSKGAVIFSGPPGTGKSLILYNLMIRNLHAMLYESKLPILFLSQSKLLLENLHKEHQTSSLLDSSIDIQFLTWDKLLADHYPEYSSVTEKDFDAWLNQNKIAINARVVHYELSLIAAIGEKAYLELGARQCHFAKDTGKQKELISLLKEWQDYLQEKKAFDPMVTGLPPNRTKKFGAIFCDETQNLPPIALASLIPRADRNQFAASLDTAQCLLSSPYIQNCLKQLLYHYYGQGGYNEIHLARTWRCPPEIITVANHLMDTKYNLDNSNNRREYKEVKSTLPGQSGLISLVDNRYMEKLQELCKSADTVVIVDTITKELREKINEKLKTNNILTPEDAIGFGFNTVILWNPISQRKVLHKLVKPNSHNNGLRLDQLNEINAIYVSITRAQKELYLLEEEAKRWKTHLSMFFGALPLNQFKTENSQVLPEQQKEHWLSLTEKYLKNGQIENAKQIMSFHLGYDDTKIADVIKPYLPEDPIPQQVFSSELEKEKIPFQNLSLQPMPPLSSLPPLPPMPSETTSKPAFFLEFEEKKIVLSPNQGTQIPLTTSDSFQKWFLSLPLRQNIPFNDRYSFYKVNDNTVAINSGPNTPGIQIKKTDGVFIAINNLTADNPNGNKTPEQLELGKKNNLITILTELKLILESKPKNSNVPVKETTNCQEIFEFEEEKIMPLSSSKGTHVFFNASDSFQKWFLSLPLRQNIPFNDRYSFYKVNDNTVAINSGPNTPGIQIQKNDGVFMAVNNITADQPSSYNTKTPKELEAARENNLIIMLTGLKKILQSELKNDNAHVEKQPELNRHKQVIENKIKKLMQEYDILGCTVVVSDVGNGYQRISFKTEEEALLFNNLFSDFTCTTEDMHYDFIIPTALLEKQLPSLESFNSLSFLGGTPKNKFNNAKNEIHEDVYDPNF